MLDTPLATASTAFPSSLASNPSSAQARLKEAGRCVIDSSSEAVIAAASEELMRPKRAQGEALSAIAEWERRRAAQRAEAAARELAMSEARAEERAAAARAAEIAALAHHPNDSVRLLGTSQPVRVLNELIGFVKHEREAIAQQAKQLGGLSPRSHELQLAIDDALRVSRKPVLALSPFARRINRRTGFHSPSASRHAAACALGDLSAHRCST